MRLKKGNAEEAGLDPRRLQKAFDLPAAWAGEGRVQGSAVAVARNGVLVPPRGFGVRTTCEGAGEMPPDAVFLVASVTKPVTATAAVMLVERGRLSLEDRVCDRVPEFAGEGREEVRLLHLLTHTSGLPDMLPENRRLRERHRPLSDFIARICRTKLLFRPGTRVSYQSMGTALIGEIVERVSGKPLRTFLQEEIFAPLGMESTSLGMRDDLKARTARVELPEEQKGTDWHWNSPYWRDFGAPWGGMYSSVADMMVFLQTFLNDGEYGGHRLLRRSSVRAMLHDRTGRLPGSSDRWGLGWRLEGPDRAPDSGCAFGHSGATGALVGADPHSGLAWAVFTTRPDAPLPRVAKAIRGARG